MESLVVFKGFTCPVLGSPDLLRFTISRCLLEF
jgi:hypothetical protein